MRALVLLVLLTACTTVRLDLGAGVDPSLERGTNPRGVFALRAEREDCGRAGWRCFGEFRHYSSVWDGKPWNNRKEENDNPWTMGVSIPIWRSP